MRSRLIQEALEAWRDGERLLGELPPGGGDDVTVDLAVSRLRDVYQNLTALVVDPDELLGASRDTVAAAREVIDRVKARSRDLS